MRSVRAWFFRVAGLFNKQRLEREMAQELEATFFCTSPTTSVPACAKNEPRQLLGIADS
jgi:hypothetical protein